MAWAVVGSHPMSDVSTVSSRNRKGETWSGIRKDSPYGPGDRTPLLSPIGRVLVAILENPSMKLADLSDFLGVNESRISFALSSLVKDKILVRTRIAGKNSYKLDPKSIETHPDIIRMIEVVAPILITVLDE